MKFSVYGFKSSGAAASYLQLSLFDGEHNFGHMLSSQIVKFSGGSYQNPQLMTADFRSVAMLPGAKYTVTASLPDFALPGSGLYSSASLRYGWNVSNTGGSQYAGGSMNFVGPFDPSGAELNDLAFSMEWAPPAAPLPVAGGSQANPTAVPIPITQLTDTLTPGVTERFYNFAVTGGSGLTMDISVAFPGLDPDDFARSQFQIVVYDSKGRYVPLLHRVVQYFDNPVGGGAISDEFVSFAPAFLDVDNEFKAKITVWGNSTDGYATTCNNFLEGTFNNFRGGTTPCRWGDGNYMLGIIANTVIDTGLRTMTEFPLENVSLEVAFSSEVVPPLPVNEPATSWILALGLVGLGLARRDLPAKWALVPSRAA